MRDLIKKILREEIQSEADPKTGTGKKPKGSGRRLYTDENPKDTVSVKFRTKQDIIDTLNKQSFKSKPHKRQSQIINLIHQRVRAAHQNAKDPETKQRLKKGLDYITLKKEQSKLKTIKLREELLNEKCWKGYTQKGMKTMFGKRYPNCVKKKKLKEGVDDLLKTITYFETSQGSKYIRLPDGRLRRWKSNHANTGGEDMGLHGWQENSFFVEPKYEKEANSIQFIQNYYNLKNLGLSKNNDGKLVLMLYKDGAWKPATWADAYPVYVKRNPQSANKVLAWEYKKEPTKGYNVVDFSLQNGRIKSYHFGSEVSKIENQIPQEEIKLFFPSKI